jgi:hypothetical protein
MKSAFSQNGTRRFTYEFTTNITSLLENTEYLGIVILEFGCLPVVDDDWSIFVCPRRSGEMITVEAVEGSRHTPKSLRGVYGKRLGSIKRLAGGDGPAQVQRIHTDLNPIQSG